MITLLFMALHLQAPAHGQRTTQTTQTLIRANWLDDEPDGGWRVDCANGNVARLVATDDTGVRITCAGKKRR